MGLIYPDRCDAFLSYAHDDNVLNDDAVWHFQRYLKRRFTAEMRRRLDRGAQDEADIFMDQIGLPANGDLTEELTRVVENCVFLIIVAGKWYPDSEWCGKELSVFTKQFDGNRQAALERTFLVVLDRDALAKYWGDSLEVPSRPIYEGFFDDESGRMIPVVLEAPDGQAVQSPRFTRRLRRIVETMADRAMELL